MVIKVCLCFENKLGPRVDPGTAKITAHRVNHSAVATAPLPMRLLNIQANKQS